MRLKPRAVMVCLGLITIPALLLAAAPDGRMLISVASLPGAAPAGGVPHNMSDGHHNVTLTTGVDGHVMLEARRADAGAFGGAGPPPAGR